MTARPGFPDLDIAPARVVVAPVSLITVRGDDADPALDGVRRGIADVRRGESLTFGLNSPAAQAYANIAERLQGRDIPLMELDVGASWRFLAPIKRFFGLN